MNGEVEEEDQEDQEAMRQVVVVVMVVVERRGEASAAMTATPSRLPAQSARRRSARCFAHRPGMVPKAQQQEEEGVEEEEEEEEGEEEEEEEAVVAAAASCPPTPHGWSTFLPWPWGRRGRRRRPRRWSRRVQQKCLLRCSAVLAAITTWKAAAGGRGALGGHARG